MRVRKKSNGLSVNGIAGSFVVFFGLDLASTSRKGFRGFAFKREDHATGEITWMRGMKTFASLVSHAATGETFSTKDHPVQSFQWADYSVKPGTRYTYTIEARYGKAGALQTKAKVTMEVTTEVEAGEVHAAYFNRGSVATQEYARRFQNKKPDDVGEAAFQWLSRGLIEAMIGFIDNTKKGDAIHGAVYEFQYPDVLAALKAASKRGVTVKVLYDAVEGDSGPKDTNEEAIAELKIKKLTTPRVNAKLMHNKFFVHLRNNKPIAVWTGSTNITKNGIFGHANVGHIVRDAKVAIAYNEYYNRLVEDPAINNEYRDANMAATPIPTKLEKGTTPIFSPRGTKLDALNWYAELADSAKDALFMTFAFGMNDKFKAVYEADDDKLKMALLEKVYGSPLKKEEDAAAIQAIRNRPNVVIAVGNRIVTNSFDRWLEEMRSVDGLGKHVYWIHTKFMLIDPLGKEPIVVTGSANFSKASTDTNDENMIVIKGDTRIADIYFGEYMRLYNHYAFREAVKWAQEKNTNGTAKEWKPQYLSEDDGWMHDYFSKSDKTGRNKRREYFSQA